MNNTFLKRMICCFVVLILFASKHTKGTDSLGRADLLDVVPQSTQLIVATRSVQASYVEIAKSSVVQNLSGPTWKSVLSKHVSTQTGSLLNPRPWLGMDWSEMSNIDQPGAIVGFLDPAGDVCMMFLVKLGAKASEHPFVKNWLSSNGGDSTPKAIKLTESSSMYVAPIKGTEVSVCLLIGAEWTCIASSPTAIQGWLTSKTSKSLQEAGLSTQARSLSLTKQWNPGECRFWCSPWTLFNGFTAKKEPNLLKSAKSYGMDCLESVIGKVLPPTANDPSWQLSYSLSMVQPLSKGLATFNLKSGLAVDPPKIIRSGMDQQATTYVDMKPWFGGINHVVDQLIDKDTPGSFGDLLDSILTDPEGPKIDIRKELIYRLGPLLFHSSATVADPKVTGLFRQNHVWALSLQDGKHASSVLNKLFDKDDDIKTERVGPYQMWYTVNDESLFFSLKKGEEQTISVAAIDDAYLYLATDTKWLSDLIAKPQSTNGIDILRNHHLKQLETQPFSMRQLMDMRSTLVASWTRMPEKPLEKNESRSLDLPALVLTKLLIPGVSAQEIPKWEQVKTAFGVISQSSIVTQRGIDVQVWIDAQ